MAMGVAGIRATLGKERSTALSHHQTTSLQHRRQNRIIQEQQLLVVKLQCHMTITKVLGRRKQVQRCGRLYLEQIF